MHLVSLSGFLTKGVVLVCNNKTDLTPRVVKNEDRKLVFTFFNLNFNTQTNAFHYIGELCNNSNLEVLYEEK